MAGWIVVLIVLFLIFSVLLTLALFCRKDNIAIILLIGFLIVLGVISNEVRSVRFFLVLLSVALLGIATLYEGKKRLGREGKEKAFAIEIASLYVIFLTLLANFGAFTLVQNQLCPPELEIQYKEVVSGDGKAELKLFYDYEPRNGLYFTLKSIPKNHNIYRTFSPFKNHQVTLNMGEKSWETPDNKIRLLVKDSGENRIVKNKKFTFRSPNLEIKEVNPIAWETSPGRWGIKYIVVNIKNTGDLPFYFKPWTMHGELSIENIKESKSFSFGEPFSSEGFKIFKEKERLESKLLFPAFEGKLKEGKKYRYCLTLGNAGENVVEDNGVFEV